MLLAGFVVGLAWCGRWRCHNTQVPDLVETVPQAVPPAPRRAVGVLIGLECVRATQACLQAAAAQQSGDSFPQLAAAQGVYDGIQARV